MSAAPGSSYGILVTEDPLSEYYLRAGLTKQELSFADSMEAYVYYRHWDTDIWNNRSGYTYTPRNYIHMQVYHNNYVGGRLIFYGNYGKHSLAYGADVESSIALTGTRQNFLVAPAALQGTSRTGSRPSTTTDFALFVKDDYKASDSWHLQGSARGDYILMTYGKTPSGAELAGLTGNPLREDILKTINDNSTMHEGALTGMLGSVYFFNDYISNVINISHNYKATGASTRLGAPAANGNAGSMVNPNLKPEYSQTAEFGFRIQSDNHFMSLIGFYTRYTNKIALASVQSGVPSFYTNIGKAYITGAELEGKHNFFDDLLTINYVGSYNYAQDETRNKPIMYVAPLYGQITFRLNFRPMYISLTERGYGRKDRIDVQEEIKLPGYVMTDLIAGVNLGYFSSNMEDMQFILGVNNLFNEVGRNPVTQLAATVANRDGMRLTNPLVEPGRNIFVKYVWNY
ncbi:TonB-dependent receptor [Helicobacter jaachi]|uniref:TonB-dependent receptor domain-containing protein n=1 Tax=Helicobacter jaachi TaxID=1677920 RepID=UPI00068FAF16|nr:TonB-dependent receptor [Helicobacter jaachi]